MQSDSKHIVQEKYRAVLCLFRKSRKLLESFEQGTALINALDTQRIALRNSDDEIDASSILSPFLTILRTPQLSGPFITLSLDAIHTFVSCNIIIKGNKGVSDTLEDVIDAVSRCRFVQTDAIGDQLVQLKIIQVLQDVVRCPLRCYLSDESAWAIVVACFSLMLNLGHKRIKSGLYQMTEQTLMDTVRFIFGATYKSEFGTISPAPVIDLPLTVDHEVNNLSTNTVCFGLPCAMKVLGYFVNIIQKYADETNPPKLNRSSSNNTDEVTLEQDVQELVIALKALQSILWSDGNIRNARDIILRCPPMASLVRDDLCRSLILLSGKRYFPPIVLQNILGLFSTLYTSFGPALKVLIECFTIYVFLKSLHQMTIMLETQDEIQSGVRTPKSQTPGSPGSIASPIQTTNQFSVEELEMIFDCLLDFIAIPGFIPSLYASFDCDATKPDAVKPLFQYLGKCASYFLSTPNENNNNNNNGPYRHSLGQLYNAALMIVQCLLQISQSTAQRCIESSENFSRIDYWLSHKEKYGQYFNNQELYSPDKVAAKLRADMMTKMLLREAAVKFVDKPKLCFRFLQDHGALDNPVTSFSVAKFLRICPGLPKDAVGAFLGESGKDKPEYEWDSHEFHNEVRHHYVRSFELSNQGILNCLRIFLSAFRLPGEAQQIDRILVAFSEHCHSCCIEGQSGLLENSEVAYLLSFAIIMLNTDRHNPNVRADRKMTLEQFIKYNTNYGSDVNQTRNLPREFLESIFTEISNLPLRTEKNDVSATLTPEMWLDLQLQAQMNPEQGFLITTICPPDILHQLKSCATGVRKINESSTTIIPETLPQSKPRQSTHQTYENTYILLTTRNAPDPILISSCVYGSHWIADAGLVDCLWMPLISAAMSPFIRQEIPTPPPASGEKPRRILRPSVSEACLATGKELFLMAVKLCHTYNLSVVVDALILLLADFAGLVKGDMIDSMVKTLMPLGPLSIELNAGIAHLHESIPFTSDIAQKVQLEKQTQEIQNPSAFTYRVSTEFMTSLMTFPPAIIALQCLLQIAVKNPNYLGSIGWLTIWNTLAILRDITVLPIELICGEDDIDLLHPKAREDYEERMALTRCQEIMLQREDKLVEKIKQLTKTSVLSFQGLGEVLFGSTSNGQPTETEILLRKDMETKAGYEGMQSVQSGRWNAGYPTDIKSASSLKEYVDYIEFYSSPLPNEMILIDPEEYDEYIQILGKVTVLKLRKMMIDENILQIISDSKFLEEKCILLYFQQLCQVMERKGQNGKFNSQIITTGSSLEPVYEPVNSLGGYGIENLKQYLIDVSKKFPIPTEASSAWLEMVLVEATMRNRDRFSLIWPMISTHYSRSFYEDESIVTSSSHLEGHPVIISHSIDRRVTGIFKIATRMLSRSQLCGPIIHLLSNIFGHKDFNDSNNSNSNHTNTIVKLNNRKDSFCSTDLSSLLIDVHIHDYILFEISGQIASGMWILLTQNALVLPNLQLDQWQQLFGVISMAAKGGGYAAMKSFETMAWLIHEPSLRAEVPVFCVQAVRPLLSNPHAPYSVATGAINLLLHLHGRLEVLVKDENAHLEKRIINGEIIVTQSFQETDGLEYSNNDNEAPLLWESCWIPILQAISEGIHDKRLPVKRCAVDALCLAISDKHAYAVPIEVLITILRRIVIPTAEWLGNDLIQSVNDGTYSSSLVIPDENPTDYKMRTEFYQNGNTNESPKSKAMRCGVTSDLLSTLCKVFLIHLNRLITSKSFDDLWKSILSLLTYYLDSPPPMGHGFDNKYCKTCIEIQQTVDISNELLKNLILVMSNNGYFNGNGKNGQLLIITRQATGNLVRSPNLLNELLENK